MRSRMVWLCGGALVAAAAACSDEYPLLSPSTVRDQFTATLAGTSEVPPVTTQATGTGTLVLYDTNTVRYEVTVANITAVTAAHVHAGATGQNGPVMVTLFSTTTPTAAITGGVLRQGDITRSTTFTAPFTFDSLVNRMRAGTAYVNVHTSANPGGEIRGQLAQSASAPTGR